VIRRSTVTFMAILCFSEGAYAAPDLSRCAPLDPKVLNGDRTELTYHDINDPGSAGYLNLVEGNHFNEATEQLVRGQTSVLPADIAFVLNMFPNHYRALTSMARWWLTHDQLPPDFEGRVFTADCYFMRAMDFRPNDWKVRLIYGTYLHRAKRLNEAQQQYAAAEEHGGTESADLYYDWGLLELDLGDIVKAREYADKAYAMGYPLPGLRQKLARATASQSPQKKATSEALVKTPEASASTSHVPSG
jgi:Tfp pilus assembly protein PilF